MGCSPWGREESGTTERLRFRFIKLLLILPTPFIFKKQFHINIDGAYYRPGAVLVPSRSVSEKVGLKLNIQKIKIMASGPITSWQIDGETVETVRDFILGAPKSLQMVTAAMKLKDAYSLEEK